MEAEIERQRELIDGGGAVSQETLHFDPGSGSLTPLRSKEFEHDYRYFPEPDLVPLAPTEEMLREAAEALPELPGDRAERYRERLGLSADVATLLAADTEAADYFEHALKTGDGTDPQTIANWVTGELAGVLRQSGEEGGPAQSKVDPDSLAKLVKMVGAKQVSHGSAKQVLAQLAASGGDPAEIVEREGLGQLGGGEELEGVVEAAIEAEPEAAAEVRGGNQKAIGRIVGTVMKETKGRADGGDVQRLIREKLGV